MVVDFVVKMVYFLIGKVVDYNFIEMVCFISCILDVVEMNSDGVWVMGYEFDDVSFEVIECFGCVVVVVEDCYMMCILVGVECCGLVYWFELNICFIFNW